MITKKQSIIQNIILSLFFVVSTTILFTNCRGDEDVYSEPQITISPEGDIAFGSGVESKTITINTNRPWRIVKEKNSDWIDISPMEGKEGTSTITITVKSAPVARENYFTIVSSILKNSVNITQAGADGSVIKYVTIKELRNKYAEAGQDTLTIVEPLKVKAVVISDRVGGNSASLKNGYIQDESGSGIAFRVTELNHSFALGDEVNINLFGATVSTYAEALQISFSTTTARVQNQGVPVSPKELTISEIEKGMFDATLVKVKNVQFKEYAGLTYQTGTSATNRMLEDCSNFNLTVRTTQYANFAEEPLPAGNGNLTGVLSIFNGTWQLFVRNIDDAKEMSNDASSRCTPKDPPVSGTVISVADLRAALVQGQTYTEDRYVEGEVILNSSEGNIANFVVYVADATGGVAFTFSDADNVLTKMPLGAKVKVNVKDTKHTIYNGLLQIGASSTLSTQKVEQVEAKSSTPLVPKVVTIADINAGKYQSELVQINDVQFKEPTAKYSGSQSLINQQSESATVYTNKNATFAGETVKEGMGPFIGVVSIFNSPQLLIRSVNDLSKMTGARFVEPIIKTDKSSLTFDATAGSQTVTITSNVNWTASSDQSWLSVSPTSGSNDGVLTVTTQANPGEPRSATITLTNGTLTTTISVTQAGGSGAALAIDLFFSEYVEGSSNNKYLEIYNGTGKDVDLSDYKVVLYSNGSTTPGNTELLTGTLANGTTLVIRNSAATIYNGTAITSTVTYFNGDDAVALVKISNGAFVDIFGRIGEDPGTAWTDANDANLTTLDKTLVRKPTVRGGVTTNPDSGFPTLSTEWISYPKDTATYLGSHTMN